MAWHGTPSSTCELRSVMGWTCKKNPVLIGTGWSVSRYQTSNVRKSIACFHSLGLSQDNHSLPRLFSSGRTHKYLVGFCAQQCHYFFPWNAFSSRCQLRFLLHHLYINLKFQLLANPRWRRNTVASLPEGGAVRICDKMQIIAGINGRGPRRGCHY